MMDFIEDNTGKLIIIALVLVVGLGVWATYEDQQQWDVYAQTHHCRAVGQKAASNGVGFDSKGKTVITYNPSQTIYQCDGGEMQIR